MGEEVTAAAGQEVTGLAEEVQRLLPVVVTVQGAGGPTAGACARKLRVRGCRRSQLGSCSVFSIEVPPIT